MKKNQNVRLSVEEIGNGLIDLSKVLEAGGPYDHPEMKQIPEWKVPEQGQTRWAIALHDHRW